MSKQRKIMIRKYMLLAFLPLCLWACTEDEIQSYHGEQYLRFQPLEDSEQENIAVSFNNYPTNDEIVVKIGLELIGIPFEKDTPYKVTVVNDEVKEGDIPNALPENYRLPESPVFKAGMTEDVLEVVLVKTDNLKEDVKLRLQLESNEHFAGSMPLFDQMEIVFNNVISPPLWWKGDVIKLFLGTYSRKKYVDFVTFSGISDFGALSTAEKRQAALEFKYYVAANNIMDKDDKTGEEFPMVIPVD